MSNTWGKAQRHIGSKFPHEDTLECLGKPESSLWMGEVDEGVPSMFQGSGYQWHVHEIKLLRTLATQESYNIRERALSANILHHHCGNVYAVDTHTMMIWTSP